MTAADLVNLVLVALVIGYLVAGVYFARRTQRATEQIVKVNARLQAETVALRELLTQVGIAVRVEEHAGTLHVEAWETAAVRAPLTRH